MQSRSVKVFSAFVVALFLGSEAHAASLTLAWDHAGDGLATRYIIFYGTAPGEYPLQREVGFVTSSYFDGLDGSKEYCFAIKAIGVTGTTSGLSREVCGVPGNGAPPPGGGAPPPGGGGGGGATPPPGGGGTGAGTATAPPPKGNPGAGTFAVRATVRQDRFVDLTWDLPPKGATGYRVEIGRQSGQTDLSGFVHAASSTLDFGEREPGVYYARVLAMLGSEWGDQSHEVSFVITHKTTAPPAAGTCSAAPAAPVDFVATAHGALVQLSWRAGAGDATTGFMLYVGSAPGRQDLMTVPLGPMTALSATAANGTYALHLVAMNACGASTWGADALLTVGPAAGGSSTGAATSQLPGAPTGLTGQVVGNTVILTWTPPSTGGAATRYVLEAMTAAGPVAVELGGTSTTFTHPNTPSGQYDITVRAGNAAGLGPASSSVTVVVP